MEKEKTTEKVDQKVDENTNEIQIKEQKEKKIIRTIEAKVIKVVDKYNLIVDKGSEDGIETGDTVYIYYTVDVSSELGSFDFEIARLSVSRTKEHMSLCISDEFKSNLGNMSIFGPQERLQLPIKELIKKTLSEDDKKIGLGSKARITKKLQIKDLLKEDTES